MLVTLDAAPTTPAIISGPDPSLHSSTVPLTLLMDPGERKERRKVRRVKKRRKKRKRREKLETRSIEG